MSLAKSSESVVIKVETQIVTLEPGLYLFRYASDIPEGQQVPATLQAAPVSNGQVDFFPGIGVSRNTLRQLGDCIVVRVSRDQGGILIAKYRVPGQAAAGPIQIQIDLVDTSGRFVREVSEAPSAGGRVAGAGAGAGAGRGSPQESSWPQSDLIWPSQQEQIELRGHLERRGDVAVAEGWLGDPRSSARLEGFSVYWHNRPQDVDLVYRCQVDGLGESPAISSGGFAGTRGRGASIRSVAFALVGQHANNYELRGQAVFAGGQAQPIVSGRRLTGSTGREHLCALLMSVGRKNTGEATVPRSPSPWDDPSVTQVFRAGR